MEQAVLLTDGPRAGKAEALAQPQHGLEALDGASRRGEGAEAADPGLVLLHSEVVTLDGPVANVQRPKKSSPNSTEPPLPPRFEGGVINRFDRRGVAPS